MQFPYFSRLFLSIWFVYLFHFRHLAAGSDRFVLLMMAIVERGTIRLDAYSQNPFYQPYLGDIILYNNHAYANINTGISFLAVPAWSVFYFFYKFIPETSLIRHEALHYFIAHFVGFAFTTALFGALTACLIALIVYHKTQQQWRSIGAALLYAVGSIAFYLSTRLNQNIPIIFIVTVGFIYLFLPTLVPPKKIIPRLITLGLLLGFGIIIDMTMFPGLAVIGIFLLSQQRHSLKNIIWVVLGAIFPLFLQFIYQFIAFGNPFLSPALVFIQQSTGVETVNPADMGLNFLNFVNIAQYLFSLKAGLFVYLPYSLLSVYYFVRFLRTSAVLNSAEKRFIAALFGIYLIFLLVLPSRYLYSLFGPRYIAPVIPFMSILFALYWRSQEFKLGVILIAFSFLFNLAGAQLGNDPKNILATTVIYSLRGPWLPVVDWLQIQLPQATAVEIEILRPYGLLLLLGLVLGLLWGIPHPFPRHSFKENRGPQSKFHHHPPQEKLRKKEN
jgi:hypothetical protein